MSGFLEIVCLFVLLYWSINERYKKSWIVPFIKTKLLVSRIDPLSH